MSDQLASSETLSGVEAAEQEMLHGTADEPDDGRAEERSVNETILLVDRHGTQDDYRKAREYQEAFARRPEAANEKFNEVAHLTRRVREAEAETQQALEAEQAPSQEDNEEARELYEAHIRAHTMAGLSDDPQYLKDVTAEAVRREGRPGVHVQKALGSARYINEISLEIAENEGALTKLNSMSPTEVARIIAHADGYYAANADNGVNPRQQQQAPAKRVSSAPKPVPVVKGRASSNPQSLDEMPYEQYKQYRERAIRSRK